MVDLSTLLWILTAYDAGCYSTRRELTTQRSNTALSGPDHAKTIYQKIRTLKQIPDKDYAPPRQLTHNFSQPLIVIIRLSRFLTARTCVTLKRVPSSLHLFLHAALSPTHCQHLYGSKESTSNHTNNKATSKRSGAYLGHGLSSPLVYRWRCLAAAAAAATPERLQKCR